MDNVFDYRLFRIGDTTVTTASLVAAIVVLIATYVVARIARRLVADRLLARTRLSIGVRYMLGRFTGYTVFVLGAIMALQTIGIRATTLTAFGAALGVGIGFGLQDIVKNFVAGLVILIERPFEVGDRIEIDKIAAEVAEIRSRATILRTNDDVHLIVPNSRFMSDVVVNRSYDRLLYRCHAPVAVDNASDPRIASDALLDAARRTEGVLREPPPSVRFRAFGSGGMQLELLCWTDKMAHRPGALVSDLNFEIYDALRRSGIELPQTEIRVLGPEGGPGRAAPSGMEAAAPRPREAHR
jgi:small-conductance mechanosensitive channel